MAEHEIHIKMLKLLVIIWLVGVRLNGASDNRGVQNKTDFQQNRRNVFRNQYLKEHQLNRTAETLENSKDDRKYDFDEDYDEDMYSYGNQRRIGSNVNHNMRSGR